MAQIERLRQALTELEAGLRDVDSLDPESRKLLHQAAADIQTRLARLETSPAAPAEQVKPATSPAADEPAPTEPDTLQGALQERVVDFEASHPQLAMVLTRVIDLLGQAGI